ncbi:CoA transferase [Paralcaligenes sp. KSB-10]|uniref:CoA transferase n=1 Tax=Paralcaligenes sp. KSB-10 TaxID=2901142 RepID=UPI001E415386|nr:CoA transferase [Paralcaligenes sp. KSB-10]UHL63144.1 CoA transferase [Paralcaligenes sp. KSB-10]
MDTRHKLTVAAASAIGAYALAVEKWWHMAKGQRQTIAIDCLQATCALNPGQFQRQNGYSISAASLFTELKAGFYQTADDRWFYPVGSYPHLRDGVLDTLHCANTVDALAAAIGARQADELEQAFAQRKLPGVYARSPDEWRSHEQGRFLSQVPVVQIEKIADSAPEFPAGQNRPLDRVRVLDMGHVIAGPVVARSLAEHGADVLRVSPPLMQDAFRQTVDTNIGKRSGFIDLDQERDQQKMQGLIAGADVMVQSWRTHSLKNRGFGAEEAAAIRPGIIYVSVSAFGDQGSWALRGGFEQLGQAASGIALTEAPGRPRLVPTQLLNDYLTGYLGAMGAMLAMMRRAEEGGSYHVKVALTRTSMWVQDLGLVLQDELGSKVRALTTLSPLLQSRSTPFGILEQLPPVAQFSRTQAQWALPPAPTGAHETCWL